jgi:hypothetical protein
MLLPELPLFLLHLLPPPTAFQSQRLVTIVVVERRCEIHGARNAADNARPAIPTPGHILPADMIATVQRRETDIEAISPRQPLNRTHEYLRITGVI